MQSILAVILFTAPQKINLLIFSQLELSASIFQQSKLYIYIYIYTIQYITVVYVKTYMYFNTWTMVHLYIYDYELLSSLMYVCMYECIIISSLNQPYGDAWD